MVTLADDRGDDDATCVLPRPPGLGVAPIDPRFPSELSEDHRPTIPDASCVPCAEEPPEDAHRAPVPAGPPVQQPPRDDRPRWVRAARHLGRPFARLWSYLGQPFVRLWRALTAPAPPLFRLPPPPMVNARRTLVSAGEVAEADRGEHILDEVFRVPPEYLPGLEIVVHYARNLHEKHPDRAKRRRDDGRIPTAPHQRRHRAVFRGVAMTKEEASLAVEEIHRMAFNVTAGVRLALREQRKDDAA